VRSARRFYRLSLALGVAGAGVLALAVMVALRSINLGAPSLGQLLSACQEVVLSSTTAMSVMVLVFTGVGLAVLGLAVRSLRRHYRAQQLALSGLGAQREIEHRNITIRVFAHERPKAFCAGLLKPRIYLSSGALETVPSAELDAVLEHESHHRIRRDPLRVLIVQVLGDSLFFLPLMGRLRERYCALAELAADESAVAKTGDRSALAAALITFASTREPGVIGIAPERVDHLLGERPRWQLSASLLTGALVTLAGTLAGAVTLAHAASPGALSLAMLSAQACMIAMVVVPVMLGASLVLVTHRSRQRAKPA
jgi:beta-lactamase regulating signal transducer with metallopeptidase domain